MFFKIFLGLIAVFVIGLCVTIFSPVGTSFHEPKSEREIESSRNQSSSGKTLQQEGQNGVYRTISAEKISASHEEEMEEKREVEIVAISSHQSVGPQFFPGAQENSFTGFGEMVELTGVPKTEEIKVEPGTIFIPFYVKDCGWFCKE